MMAKLPSFTVSEVGVVAPVGISRVLAKPFILDGFMACLTFIQTT